MIDITLSLDKPFEDSHAILTSVGRTVALTLVTVAPVIGINVTYNSKCIRLLRSSLMGEDILNFSSGATRGRI